MTLLTSFFGKSKPVHFVVLSGLVLVYYCLANFFPVPYGHGFLYFLEKTGLLAVLLLSVGLLNFISKRNLLVKKNSYAILFFVLFAIWFTEILKSGMVICAGFFVLLALRRIFSLRSGMATKQKIFDASLWIGIAVLFVESTIFFMLLLFLAVFFYAAKDYRNWIIPFIGILTVFVFLLVFHLVVNDTFSGLFFFIDPPKFDFSEYGKIQVLAPLSLLLAFSLWTLGDYVFIFKKASGSPKSTMLLVMACFVASFFAVLFASTKNSSELLFLAIPVSILGANFFQRKKDLLFKEILLATMVVLALIIPFWE